MIEFLRRMFAPERSSETAKERLKLVLLSDHLSLAPDVVAALKRDLLEVISRYVEIDPAHADVTFEQRDREVAMLASIPITGLRDRERVVATVSESVAANAIAGDARAIDANVHGESAVTDDAAATEAVRNIAEPAGAAPIVVGEREPEAARDRDADAEDEGEPVVVPLHRRDASPEPSVSQTASSSTTSPTRRRKRRRKPAATSVPRGAPAHGTPGFD